MRKIIVVLIFLVSLGVSEEYDIKRIKYYDVGSQNLDAIGNAFTRDGYFWAHDHGNRKIWRINQCGDLPQHLETSTSSVSINLYLGQKYIYSDGDLGSYTAEHFMANIYNKDGDTFRVNTPYRYPYEFGDYVYDLNIGISKLGSFEKVSNLPDLPSGDTYVKILGNSVYSNAKFGPSTRLLLQTTHSIYLYTQNRDGSLNYQDSIDFKTDNDTWHRATSLKTFYDSDETLYVMNDKGTKKENLYKYKIENNTFKLVEKNSFQLPHSRTGGDTMDMFINHFGNSSELFMLEGPGNNILKGASTIDWFHISDFNNIKAVKTLNILPNLGLMSFWIKDRIIFVPGHNRVEIYSILGGDASFDFLLNDKEKEFSFTEKGETKTFDIKIKNNNKSDIKPKLQDTTNYKNFKIQYFLEGKDITNDVLSSKGYIFELSAGESKTIKVKATTKKDGTYTKVISLDAIVGEITNCGKSLYSEKENLKITLKKQKTVDSIITDFHSCNSVLASDFNSPITTKIVNKPFGLTLLAKSGDKKESQDIKIKKIDLLKCKTNDVVKTILDKTTTVKNGCMEFPNINLDLAYKCVNAKVYPDDKNSSIVLKSTLSDSFAIKPKEFRISAISKESDKSFRSGKVFDLKIDAVDENGVEVKNYTESINVLDINKSDKIKACDEHTLDFSKAKSFKAGTLLIDDITLSDIGNIKISVKEKKDNFYAKVDLNDKVDDISIKEAVTPYVRFYPSSFKIVSSFDGVDDNKSTVYYASKSDIWKMGAKLNIQATVKNATQDAKNFTAGCYSEDVNIKVEFQTDSSESGALKLVGKSSDITKVFELDNYRVASHLGKTSTFDYNISKDDFFQGKSKKNVSFNFVREKDIALEPLTFDTKRVVITTADSNITNTIDLNKKLKFYYLKAHVPTPQTTAKKDTKCDVFYEVYCQDCDKAEYLQNMTSSNEIRWFHKNINNPDLVNIEDTFKSSNNLVDIKKDDFNKIDVEAKNLPLDVEIYYTPSHDWLIYDKYDKTVTNHSFILKFLSTGKWAGKGSLGSTVDTEVSHIQNHSLEDF